MIADTFRGHASHHHADPLSTCDKGLTGCQEWAENRVTDPDRTLRTTRRRGRLVAFAACREKPGSGEVGGALNGATRKGAGGGLHGDPMRHAQANGFSRIRGSGIPGPGIIFGCVDVAFTRPLVADQSRRLQMRALGRARRSGPAHAILTAHDDTGLLCLIARSDVFLKH